ncbi:MAG: MMPL family transporter [Clostridiales bacterium]|nr:MMPL family transporter [Clostridiales bacterium]
MKKFSEAIIGHRKSILLITVIVCVISVFLMQLVTVNYDLASYLPPESPSTKAMNAIETILPNLQVYLPGVSFGESVQEKNKLLGIDGISSVIWLDDAIDLRAQPVEMLDSDIVSSFYRDGPLYQVTIAQEEQSSTVLSVRAMFPDALLKGEASDQADMVNETLKQVASIILYVVPLCLVILFITTRHWADPVLFLIVIGVAVLLNEGTNVFRSSVSFVTQASSAVLQLAVSIDYAVFLLHRFSEFKDEGIPTPEAMKMAIEHSASAIISSALTTIAGFLALMLMDFGIGPDMGIVLAKGVILSYISVMVILPAVAVVFSKWIDKTAHRSFMPSFKRTGKTIMRRGAPIAIILILLLPLAFMAQHRNSFIYGSGGMHSADSRADLDQKAIEDKFGQNLSMILLVPRGDRSREAQLSQALMEIPEVVNVFSYPGTVGVQIPSQILPSQVQDQFREGEYAKMILTVNSADESPEAFELVNTLRNTASRFFPEKSHLLGESAVNLDLKNTITHDNLRVLLAGMLAIGIILLINFKSVALPLILLFVIEGSIWLNMGIPYFSGVSMNYIGYQIVSAVQLGATIDYGILLSQRYLEGRRTLEKREAAAFAFTASAGSILTSASILTLAGYALGIVLRENGIISQMGLIIGRGAAISGFMVLFVLPQMLSWFDKLIQKTTIRKRGNTP